MVMDFGFVKNVMMQRIHVPCDHGLILWERDYDVMTHLGISKGIMEGTPKWVKYLLLPAVPTAENLAKYWWDELYDGISNWFTSAKEDAVDLKLDSVRVHETPNCVATYSPGEK
jgi:6-pyruvoyl-tetrahydropterin synthase